MDKENRQLHIFFLPFMAQGHMIPTIDMAKLFASKQGIKATIITTPLNAPLLAQTIQRSQNLGVEIGVLVIKFPSTEAGLPEGCESFNMAVSHGLVLDFFKATTMLEPQIEQLLQEHAPDCLVADSFFPWATDAATKNGIPRIVFQATGFFPLCVSECVRLYEPYKNVSSDSEPFSIPNLPNEIKLTREQLPDYNKKNAEITELANLFKRVRESEVRSYGVVVNSFYELEQDYADHYRKVMGRKAWHIGPLSVWNKDTEDKAQRGKESSIDEHGYCLKWLDSKKPHSVVYICFGSVADFNDSQLMQIAMGLEASGQQFIWVVKKGKSYGEEEEWLPEGFEKRMEDKGLIIRGWAPQVLILDHEAVGGFVTHCGWNSILEGVAAGVPMVTWPVSADQFYNEKLVTEVLKIGISVGVRRWVFVGGDNIKKDGIEKAVSRIMVGEEAEEMRSRAKVLGELANRAVEEGGSSYLDLNAVIEDLMAIAS
jgi:hypothetical protein